jgi:hypothetical protein
MPQSRGSNRDLPADSTCSPASPEVTDQNEAAAEPTRPSHPSLQCCQRLPQARSGVDVPGSALVRREAAVAPLRPGLASVIVGV